jgi:hypothetical protein
VTPARYRKVGDSVWPTPGDTAYEDATPGLEWKLRYAPESITREDQLVLASIVAAYRELLSCPARRRAEVVRALRPQIWPINAPIGP